MNIIITQRLKLLFLIILFFPHKTFSYNKEHYNKVWWHSKNLGFGVLNVIRLPFQETVFAYFDLSDAELYDCILSKTIFSNANFTNAKLISSGFSDANMRSVSAQNLFIQGSCFKNAQFQNAFLKGMKVGERRRVSKFRFGPAPVPEDPGAFLVDAVDSPDFTGCVFDGANLENSNFHQGAVLNNASFKRAILINSNLTQKQLAEQKAIFVEELSLMKIL